MFKGGRVVLERGVEVRQGRVAGIARLGEQAEVGEPETGDPAAAFRHCRIGPEPSPPSVEQHPQEEPELEAQEGEKGRGAPQGRVRSTSAVTSPNRRMRRPRWSFRKASASAGSEKGTSSRPIGPVTSLPIT